MTHPQLFSVLYVTHPELTPILSAIRLLWNPGAKWLPHITVRGPYNSPEDPDIFSAQIRGRMVEVVGAGRFRRPDQDIVHLEVEFEVFRPIWEMDHHNPHITLVRAPKTWSKTLAQILDGTRFSFRAKGLSELVSGAPGNLTPSKPFSSAPVKTILGRPLELSEVKQLDLGTRLELIEQLAACLRR